MSCCKQKKQKKTAPDPAAEAIITLCVVFIDACSDGNCPKVKVTFDAAEHEVQKRFLLFEDNDNNVSLHLACENGHDDVVVFLMEKALLHGIDQQIVNKMNASKETPLSLVCQRGYHMASDRENAHLARSNIVEKLFTHGADLNHAHPISLYMPLHWATFNQDDNLVRQMLNLGADPLRFDCQNQLPIDISGQLNLPFCVTAFLQHYLQMMETRLSDLLEDS